MRNLALGFGLVLFACVANAVMVTVASEDFEGTFPQAGWTVFDWDDATNGEYYWVDTNADYVEGGYSGWCVGAGADGSGLTPGSSYYPALCNSWLMTPVIDLTGADVMGAIVDFFYWMDTEVGVDTLEVVVYDGTDYYSEWMESGYTADWTYDYVDLSAYVGQTIQVAFVFTSDGANNDYSGAYVDWIDVVAYVEDNYEENDTLATAYDLSLDENTWLSTIDGYGSTYDEDWYAIYVTAGYERVVIDCDFEHASGDIDIALYDDGGVMLDEAFSMTDDERIDYEVGLGDAYYYIRVWLDTTGNEYDLKWYTATPADDGTTTIICGQASDGSGLGAALAAALLVGGAALLRRRRAAEAA